MKSQNTSTVPLNKLDQSFLHIVLSQKLLTLTELILGFSFSKNTVLHYGLVINDNISHQWPEKNLQLWLKNDGLCGYIFLTLALKDFFPPLVGDRQVHHTAYILEINFGQVIVGMIFLFRGLVSNRSSLTANVSTMICFHLWAKQFDWPSIRIRAH